MAREVAKMSTSKTASPGRAGSSRAAGNDGRTLGSRLAEWAWWLFLAMTALVPVAVTTTAFGSRAFSSWTLDAITLPKTTAIMILGGLSLACYLSAVVIGAVRFRYTRLLWLAWALVAWAGVSTLVSSSPANAVFGEWGRIEGLAAYACYALVFTLATQLVTGTGRLRTWAITVSVVALVLSLYALLQYLGVDPVVWPLTTFGHRLFATFGNPDLFADYLVFALAIAGGVVLSEIEGTRVFWMAVVATGSIGVTLVLSLVRGAWAGAVVVLVVLAFAWRVNQRPGSKVLKWAAVAAVAVVAAAVVLSVLVPQSGLTVIERVTTTLSRSNSGLGERTQGWAIAMRVALKHLVFGVGPDRFGVAFVSAADPSWWQMAGHRSFQDNAHNLVIQVLTTLGVPGLLLYLTVIVGALTATFRSFASRGADASRMLFAGVWAGVLGLAIALLAGVTTPPVVCWLWMGAGVLAASTTSPVALERGSIRVLASAVAALALAFSALGGVWLLADALAARGDAASTPAIGSSLLSRAIALDPFPTQYRIALGAAWEKGLLATGALRPTEAEARTLADKAVAAYADAAAHDPHDAEASLQLLYALDQRNATFPDQASTARALALAATMRSTWPDVPDILTEVAITKMNAGMLPQAELDARRSIEIDPEFSRGWLTLGQILVKRGMNEQARAAFESALRMDPQNTEAANALQQLSK